MFQIYLTAQRTKQALGSLALALACVLSTHCLANAQPPAAAPAERSKTEQQLTEGLLDLLTEPAPKPAKQSVQEQSTDTKSSTAPGAAASAGPSTVPATPSTPPPLGGERGMGTKDLGTQDLGDGEDLGASGTNPLAEVQMEMLTAAGWLRERTAVDKAEELQRHIVARLDQLIDDLNQQSPSPSQPPPNDSQTPSPSEPPQPSQAQQASAQQAEGTETARGQQAQPDPVPGQETQAAAPGTEGQPAPGALERKEIIVDLNDPTALQRSAWGNLPDRVREQMQSRMVERFLPGYREEIEAYYRALSR